MHLHAQLFDEALQALLFDDALCPLRCFLRLLMETLAQVFHFFPQLAIHCLGLSLLRIGLRFFLFQLRFFSLELFNDFLLTHGSSLLVQVKGAVLYSYVFCGLHLIGNRSKTLYCLSLGNDRQTTTGIACLKQCLRYLCVQVDTAVRKLDAILLHDRQQGEEKWILDQFTYTLMTLNGITQLLLDGCRVPGYLFFDFFLCSILLLHITAHTRTTPARQECRDLLRSQFSNGIVTIASK